MEKYSELIIRELEKHYPNPQIFLDVSNPLESMVATMLSAQCTDRQVNKVIKKLFIKYRSVQDYANANLGEFEQDIKSTGFYRNKAKNILDSCRIILEKFSGKLPDNMEDLVSLPGIGRKTANIIMSNGYGKLVGIPIDTHMKRVNFRLGLTKNTDPDKIEQDLIKSIPKDKWFSYTYSILRLGREYCKAPVPICSKCFLKEICRKKGVVKSG